MIDVILKRFETPDEVREMVKGRFLRAVTAYFSRADFRARRYSCAVKTTTTKVQTPAMTAADPIQLRSRRMRIPAAQTMTGRSA